MMRFGKPPFLECSSVGDKRFSAFYAHVNGRSIEAQYQAAKILPDGRTGLSVRAAKGQFAVNGAECAALYEQLWRQYITEHPELVPLLTVAPGLSDVFGQVGHQCQAEVLWRIRNELQR